MASSKKKTSSPKSDALVATIQGVPGTYHIYVVLIVGTTTKMYQVYEQPYGNRPEEWCMDGTWQDCMNYVRDEVQKQDDNA